MNVKKLLEKMGQVVSNSDLRAGFFQRLVSSLAIETEILYPDRLRPGPEYDRAIGNLSTMVKAKGKIHAYYNLYCRWSVAPGHGGDLTVEDDLAFFEKLFDELDSNPEVRDRVYEVVSRALHQLTRRAA